MLQRFDKVLICLLQLKKIIILPYLPYIFGLISTPYHTCSNIWTSTIYYLKMLCLKIAGWVANSVDPDEMQCFASSYLGLHCLLRPVCPNTYGKCGITLLPFYPKSWDTSTPYFILPKILTTPFDMSMCLKIPGWVTNNIDPHSTASDLDLHCLLRPVCPND